jgi:hypothetical protein
MADQTIANPAISAQKTSLGLDPLRQKLKEELEKSLLLEKEDRHYWLENLPNLPLPIVENLLKSLVPKNDQVNNYINAALAQDQNQEHLKALKLKTKQIIQGAFKLEEKSESGTEQQSSEELLQKLQDL